MAGIQDGDLIYVRAVVGLPDEFLLGNTGTGTLTLNYTIGNPDSLWVVRVQPDRTWTLECQHDHGRLRFLDSDAALNVTMDDDPSDRSTHWQFIQTATPGHWQIRSLAYGHFLSVGNGHQPTVTNDGNADLAHWQLLLIAQ